VPEASPASRLLALLLGVGLALGLAEALLRVLRPAAIDRIRYPCIYQPDAELGFRYRPHASGVSAGHFEYRHEVATNSLGFHDDEPLPPGQARPRILAVGDSFTAAKNVPRQQGWTAVLERALRAGGWPRADVVNLGLDGTGTDVHAALLREQWPRLRPDVIVLAFFANDFGDVLNGRFQRECYRDTVLAYQTPAQRQALRARVDAWAESGWRRALYRRSHLVRLLAAPFLPRLHPARIQFLQPSRAELGLDAATRRARRPRWQAALAELEAIAAACDCRLLVAPVPPRSRAAGSLEVWRRRAGGSALEVIDPLPAIERRRRARGLAHEDLYFVHDNHLNAVGNELYGKALAEVLLGGQGG
jgi:lysophospholipase L1-like esterase